MLRLFLIRHGETDWNRQRKLQGHTDIPLNLRGLDQARGLQPLLRQLNLDHVASSDLLRAKITAETALPSQALRLNSALREIHLGQAEGLTREDIALRWGPVWEQWNSPVFDHYQARFPQGESRRDGLERLFRYLRQETQGAGIGSKWGFFTHGLLLRSFAQWAEGLEVPRFTTPNCCVFEWKWQSTDLDFQTRIESRPKLQQIYLLPDDSLTL